MTPDEFIAEAQKRGLAVTEKGINLQALEGTKEGRTVAEASGAKETEKEFQERVIAFAQAHGWRVAAIRRVLVKMGERTHYETPMAADGAGYPDLTMMKHRAVPYGGANDFRLIFAELKTDTGTVRPEQKEWLDDLASVAGFRVLAVVWRPKDWEEITRILKGE